MPVSSVHQGDLFASAGVSDSLCAKRVLVTGGCGMLGSAVVRALVQCGAEVRVLDNLRAYRFDYRARFLGHDLDVDVIEGDLRNAMTVERAVSATDYVVHAGAYADVAGCVDDYTEDFSSNVQGTFNVLRESARRDVQRLVFISSASVYGQRDGDPLATSFVEDDVPRPLSTYANSKLWGEHECRLFAELYGLPTVSLRLFSLYGPRQVPKEGSHSWCIAFFVMRALLGQELVVYGDGSQVRDFVHVADMVRAVLHALATPGVADGRVINIGGGQPTRVLDVARLISSATATSTGLQFAPPRPADPRGGFADIGRAVSDLAWLPRVGLEAGVNDYIDWVRTNLDLIPAWLRSQSSEPEERVVPVAVVEGE
jgi:UDP-glucose 4-epimerase/dTDP-L-rhamnose 4-epimerase